MFGRLLHNARRLHSELSQSWAGLKPRPDLMAESAEVFRQGRFPAASSQDLLQALQDFYVRALGLPAPRIVEVQSLQQAAQLFRVGPRLPVKAALLLNSLHRASPVLSQVVLEWNQRISQVWELPRVHRPCPWRSGANL
jgi:hypothetical protein